MPAGSLRERVTFSARSSVPDEYGNVEGAWSDQFTVAARIRPLRGGEDVMAARLQGTQPVIITVRQSSLSILITTDWRAVDARSGAQYQITSITNTDEKNAYLDILATTGVAV